MKKVVILFICLTVELVSYAQDVRDVSWGMSMEQVIRIEGEDFLTDETSEHPIYVPGSNRGLVYVYLGGRIRVLVRGNLVYNRQLIGKEALLVYAFSNDKLISASYWIDDDVFDRLKRA